MTGPHMETKLNEYVDDTLTAHDRASVEAHLADCAPCRAAVAELRSLSAAAASLPRSIEPGRDLWAGVETRIAQRATWNVQRFRWGAALAAAAVLVIALGLYRLLPPFAAHDRPAGEGAGWATVQADFDRATDSSLLPSARGCGPRPSRCSSGISRSSTPPLRSPAPPWRAIPRASSCAGSSPRRRGRRWSCCGGRRALRRADMRTEGS